MKKNYFMLAAATMMLAACAETDLVNEVNVESTPQAIGFETFANKATRAENSSAAYSWKLEEHHSSFRVWGGKKLNDGTLIPVYPTTTLGTGTVTHDGTNWHANPIKYWDKAAERYVFFAAAPAEADWVADVETANDFSTGYVTLSNFELKGTNLSVEKATSAPVHNWKGEDDVDLLISENTLVERTHYTTSGNTNVHLNFSHILSRLNVIVCKHADVVGDVAVTELVVDKLKNKGSFNESLNPATSTSPGSNNRWIDQGGSYSIMGLTGNVSTNKDAYLIQSLVIPQTITKETIDVNGGDDENQAYFKIAYTIAGEPFYGYYNLAAAFGGDTFDFGEGWQNTLTITINPTGITFSGKVAEWAAPTPTPDDFDIK